MHRYSQLFHLSEYHTAQQTTASDSAPADPDMDPVGADPDTTPVAAHSDMNLEADSVAAGPVVADLAAALLVHSHPVHSAAHITHQPSPTPLMDQVQKGMTSTTHQSPLADFVVAPALAGTNSVGLEDREGVSLFESFRTDFEVGGGVVRWGRGEVARGLVLGQQRQEV